MPSSSSDHHQPGRRSPDGSDQTQDQSGFARPAPGPTPGGPATHATAATRAATTGLRATAAAYRHGAEAGRGPDGPGRHAPDPGRHPPGGEACLRPAGPPGRQERPAPGRVGGPVPLPVPATPLPVAGRLAGLSRGHELPAVVLPL